MGKSEANYGITRVDTESGTHGWQVRLQRSGRIYSKFFSDKSIGSAPEALRASRAFRDELLESLKKSFDEEVSARARSARNSSGVVGVSRVKVLRVGSTYPFWQAAWSPKPGQRRTVKFSILRYGENEAFRLACEARQRATRGNLSGNNDS